MFRDTNYQRSNLYASSDFVLNDPPEPFNGAGLAYRGTPYAVRAVCAGPGGFLAVDGTTDPKSVVVSAGDIQADPEGVGLTVARSGANYILRNTAPVYSAAHAGSGDVTMVVADGGGIRGLRAGANVELDGATSDGAVAIDVPDAGIESVVQNYIAGADISCVSLVCRGPTVAPPSRCTQQTRTGGATGDVHPVVVVPVRPSDVTHTSGQLGLLDAVTVASVVYAPVLRYAGSTAAAHRGEAGLSVWGLPPWCGGGFDLELTLLSAAGAAAHTLRVAVTVRNGPDDRRQTYEGSLRVPAFSVAAPVTVAVAFDDAPPRATKTTCRAPSRRPHAFGGAAATNCCEAMHLRVSGAAELSTHVDILGMRLTVVPVD